MITKEVSDQLSLIEALIIRLRYEHDSEGPMAGFVYVSRSLERATSKIRDMLEPKPAKVDERVERIASILIPHYLSQNLKLEVAIDYSIQAAAALIVRLEQK